MDTGTSAEFSQLLTAWSDGDQRALDTLISIVYPEIRRIARLRLGRGSPPTLESAAVANEAYLRLFRSSGIHCDNRLKFHALCAQVIRRIVSEYARSGRYTRRGGGVVRVVLDPEAVGRLDREPDLVALDETLSSLSAMDPRKGQLVELHCFGGLTIEETAEIIGISRETAKRDWKMAKSWLRSQLENKTALRR